jgi:cytosine/adenosine deaminase-related metal-dependent hydrolase
MAMADRRPVLFRNGTVLTMDDAHTVVEGGDVLVVDDKIAEVGTGLSAPDGAIEVDATGGIVMPGMIDTHRHMWQTAMRAYGADWTLTQYFVWYYLEHGRRFRPEDIGAGNLLSGWESLEAGVTTTVDWSHGLQTVDHADAAVDALQAVPGRFVLAYGNIQAAPWEWTADPAVRSFFERRRTDDDLLSFQLAFDVLGEESFPESPAFAFARELGLPHTTHAGVWGATNDNGIRLMHENGFMGADNIYVHAATLSTDSYQRIAATGGSVSVSTESEQSAGQGYPPTWQVRQYDIPVSLSMDTSVWWSGDLFSAMRTTLGADRSREHLEAHANGDTVTHSSLRAEQVVDWATRGGARALGRDDLGQLTAGMKADVVLIKNDDSPVSFPLLNPYGHVAFQAQRGDVHTVVVDGHVVKAGGKLVGADLASARTAIENTVDFLKGEMGEDVWRSGMNPDLPNAEVLDNPYQYTDYKSEDTHGARGTIFGEPGSGDTD